MRHNTLGLAIQPTRIVIGAGSDTPESKLRHLRAYLARTHADFIAHAQSEGLPFIQANEEYRTWATIFAREALSEFAQQLDVLIA